MQNILKGLFIITCSLVSALVHHAKIRIILHTGTTFNRLLSLIYHAFLLSLQDKSETPKGVSLKQ